MHSIELERFPSIKIGISSLRKRPSKQQNGLDEFDLSMNDLIPNHAHKVGGISNALHVMSKVGAPTKVERQLTFQLEVDLRRFRRSRDYFPFDMTPSELAKYYPPQSVNMTHGEILLRKGLESNTGPKKRRVREKSHKSAPEMLETNGSLLTESPRIDGDDIHQVAEVDRDGFIVNEYNTQYEIKENIVPKQFDTQHLADSAISPDRDEIKAEEDDNIRTESQEHARAEPSPIKSVDTYATTPFEEPEPIPVITNRTLSPGDASDIIRNVMDANAVSENNTFRSVPTTTRTINETREDGGLERSTTFLTSEQNNALPEVIPV
ncbi:hypothetical protein FSP39_005313 [Pinctada imbricata]|uniref:Uncharacterized protein n=1 Tax=Pinctada imbricata TaxID=66713 RepID=A0AA89C6M8_PINIB|nr:hypothetical protein FSP39_005313 [Pinctada imbricata]